MPDLPSPPDKNLARLLVRRHLRSWLKSDVISETMVTALFMRYAQAHPDLDFRAVSAGVDAELHQLLEIVLGTQPPEPEPT